MEITTLQQDSPLAQLLPPVFLKVNNSNNNNSHMAHTTCTTNNSNNQEQQQQHQEQQHLQQITPHTDHNTNTHLHNLLITNSNNNNNNTFLANCHSPNHCTMLAETILVHQQHHNHQLLHLHCNNNNSTTNHQCHSLILHQQHKPRHCKTLWTQQVPLPWASSNHQGSDQESPPQCGKTKKPFVTKSMPTTSQSCAGLITIWSMVPSCWMLHKWPEVEETVFWSWRRWDTW